MTRKTLGYVVAAAIVALGLSGCFRFTSEYTLHEDNTVSGTIVVAFEEGNGDQDPSQITGGQDLAEQFENVTVSDYNEDGYSGTKFEFTGEPIDKLSSDSEDLSITRVDDTFVIDGSLGSADQVVPGVEAWVTVTFPGEVIEHNGTAIEDPATGEIHTVKWDAADEQFEVHAIGGATAGGGGSGGGIPAFVWAILGLLVVIGAGAFLIIQDRRSKAGAAPTDAA